MHITTLFSAGVGFVTLGLMILIMAFSNVTSKAPNSYPDDYVEKLPAVVNDPSERLDSIWPLYKVPDTERFYLIGEWHCMPSSAPTKSKQTWVQKGSGKGAVYLNGVDGK